MSKAVVRVGYKEYIMSSEAALKIADAISDAEMYEAVWHSEKNGVASHYTYHVYDRAHDDKFTIEVAGDSHYSMAKLAGKPAKE